MTEKVSGVPFCTIQSTALIFGLDPDDVEPLDNRRPTDQRQGPSMSNRYFTATTQKQQPVFEKDLNVAINQALLYRLASGDSNSIHIDPGSIPPLIDSPEDENGTKRPILHGLATLGMATRLIEQFIRHKLGPTCKFCLTHVEAQFTKPVFVGDELRIRIWNHETRNDMLLFQVFKTESEQVTIDQGTATFAEIDRSKL